MIAKFGPVSLDVVVRFDNGTWRFHNRRSARVIVALLFFLALTKESGELGQEKFLVLDDALQSVDASVRVGVMDFVLEHFSDWQLIITGHDRGWLTLPGAYPFLAEGGLGSEGVFVGQDLYSGSSFVYDPWILYARVLATAPNLVLAGIVGSGKSCLAKSLYTRSIPFGCRVYVPRDPKGEHHRHRSSRRTRHRTRPQHAQPAQPDRRGPSPLWARRCAMGQPDRLPSAGPRRNAR